MNKVIGTALWVATPAAIGYGVGKLFGASTKVTTWLTIGGAVLGAASLVTIIEALKKMQ